MILDYIFLDESICPSCKEEEIGSGYFCKPCTERLDLVNYSEYTDQINMLLSYPLFYNNFLSKLVSQFKFGGQTHLYKPFGDLMYDLGVQESIFDRVDTIVPVPLHRAKYKQRGYNQSYLLAKRISEKTGIPIRDKLVKKVKRTKEQNTLSTSERMSNLDGSIRTDDEVYKYKILLIDDVYTTGSTINSILDSFSEDPVHIETLVLTSGQRIIY